MYLPFHYDKYLHSTDHLQDRDRISEPRDWLAVQANIRAKAADTQALPIARRLLTSIIPFPRSLANLVGRFSASLHPNEVEDKVLWGLIDVNVVVSGIESGTYLRMVIDLVEAVMYNAREA